MNGLNPYTITLTDDQLAGLSRELLEDVWESRDVPNTYEIFCVPYNEYKKIHDELESLKQQKKSA